MDDLAYGKRNKRGDWTPGAYLDIAPVFVLPPRALCARVESDRDSRISEILIQPVGWAEASRRWQSRIRKTCVTA